MAPLYKGLQELGDYKDSAQKRAKIKDILISKVDELYLSGNAFEAAGIAELVGVPSGAYRSVANGYYASAIDQGLSNIVIPNGVTSIEGYAFYNCDSLKSITIPDSVTFIGERAFDGCSSLKSITIPDSVTLIGYNAFYNCSSLTSIAFEGTVEQWYAITKDFHWDMFTGSYTVYCTDGEITKSGTLIYYRR